MKKINGSIVSLLLCLLVFFGFSYSNPEVGVGKKTESAFSVSLANKRLDQINQKLAVSELNIERLKKAVSELDELKNQAATCVDQAEIQRGELASLPGQKTLLNNKNAAEKSDYINKRESDLTETVNTCQAFILRAKEAIHTYNETIQSLSQNQLFNKSGSFWSLMSEEVGFLSEAKESRLSENWDKQLGLYSIGLYQWLGLLLGFLVAWGIGYAFKVILNRYLDSVLEMDQLKVSFACVLRRYACWLLAFGVASIVGASIFSDVDTYAEIVIYGLFGLSFALALLQFLFKPIPPSSKRVLFGEETGARLFRRLSMLSVIILIGYLGYYSAEFLLLSPPLQHLVAAVYTTIAAFGLVWVLLAVNHSQVLKEKAPGIRYLVNVLLISFAIVVVFLEWVGYQNLSFYLVLGVAKTLLLFLLIAVVLQILFIGMDAIEESNGVVAQKLRHEFGLDKKHRFTELLVARVGLWFLAIGFFSVAVLSIWRVSPNGITQWVSMLMQGIHLGQMIIVPLKITMGLFTFSVAMLIGRWAATHIARQRRYRGSHDTQVALFAIYSYVFFSLALLFGLIVAGVDFTGLAIIAGALSVGLGLGMQNIVNNFVSGLILLIEKPIRAGDRVVVGGTEGFVRKVSIRSTRISTLSREDIIVPNADLISKEVTNFMFQDRQFRVSCPVGVSYGSNIELVKQVLLEVALAHPLVVKEGAESVKPRVLFREFGSSSLNFELWCIIEDVNEKYSVQSELNFAIVQAFTKHKITIPFPQCDVHLYNKP